GLVGLLPDRTLSVDARGRPLPSIALLEVVLIHRFEIDSQAAAALVRPFRAVQDLRSKVGAHLTSSTAIAESLARAGIDAGTEPVHAFTRLATDLADAINRLAGI